MSSDSINALLFDLGGVVINIDFERALSHWQHASALSLQEIRQRFSMDLAYEQHERGEIEAADYFAHLRQQLSLTASDEEIAAGWNAIYVGEIDASLNAIESVREQIPCYAFTNSNTTHQEFSTAAYPRVMSAFDHVFVSSELGLRKPEAKAFQAIAAATKLELPGILFFDDTLDNVTGAQQAGLQAVHVQTPEDVSRRLAQWRL